MFLGLTIESGNFEGSRSTVVGPWSIYIILRAGSKVYGIDLSSIVSSCVFQHTCNLYFHIGSEAIRLDLLQVHFIQFSCEF